MAKYFFRNFLLKKQKGRTLDDMFLDRAQLYFDEFSNSESTFYPKSFFASKKVRAFISEIRAKFDYINQYFSKQAPKEASQTCPRIHLFINEEIFDQIEHFLVENRHNVFKLKVEKHKLEASLQSEISSLRMSINESRQKPNSLIPKKIETFFESKNRDLERISGKERKYLCHVKKFLKKDLEEVLKKSNWAFETLFEIWQDAENCLQWKRTLKEKKFIQIFKRWKCKLGSINTKLIFFKSM